MGLDIEVLDTLEGVEPITAAWDDLAVAADRPYCAPAWLLAWWRHVAPSGALLRVIVARERDGLAGVAPLYAVRRNGIWTYELMATDMCSRVEPLVRPDVAQEAAGAIAAGLAGAGPRPGAVVLEGVPADSGWAERLRAAWPGRRRPHVHRRSVGAAPTVALDADDIDAWLAARSSNFRHQMRRFRRRLDKAGAVHRVTQEDDGLEADVSEFERLHRSRWDPRGGTDAFPPGAARMLVDAGRELLPAGRYRLATIEIDNRAISSQLYLSAGRELTIWNTGFDDAYGDLRPSYVGLVDGVAWGLDSGFDRFDLGHGTQPYKYRFASGEDELERVTLIPLGPAYPLARAAHAPHALRYAIGRRLTAEQKDRIRARAERVAALRSRLGGGR